MSEEISIKITDLVLAEKAIKLLDAQENVKKAASSASMVTVRENAKKVARKEAEELRAMAEVVINFYKPKSKQTNLF